MEPVPPPPDAERILASLGMFAGRDQNAMRPVLDAVEWWFVPAGERLFSVGDPADGMYVIADGRVRFFADIEGTMIATAEAGKGVAFGEGALLTGGGRSRAAVVVRDSLLGRLLPTKFEELLETTPAMGARIAHQLATRLSLESTSPRTDLTTYEHTVLVPDGVSPAATHWLAAALGSAAGAAVTEHCSPCAPAPSIVVGGDGEICRHAGRLVIVAPASDLPGRRLALQPAMAHLDPLARPVTDLVLLRTPGNRRPPQTEAWVDRHHPAHHFFVTEGSARDAARLARHLSGRAVGLVLGGGGARGMAHIGALRALDELGIPVDAVGGSSMGAVIGAQLGLGWSWREMAERNRHGWSGVRRAREISLPTVSISSGKSLRRLLDGWFDRTLIEDLLLPYFCTSVNLSRFRLQIHHTGRVAHWVRASCSAPGLWPPVVDDDGELHIDGGQLNNVPTDVMRRHHSGTILAIDVAAEQSPMTVPRGAVPRVGIRHLLSRRARYPSLVDTLGRCALLGSLQQRAEAAAHADVYLTPDCSIAGFSSFKRIEETMAIGYRSTVEALSDPDVRSRIYSG
jgi:NTE family protein